MFSAIKTFVNDKIFGKLLHRYGPLEIKHGEVTCQDKFEIREKNDRRRLFHERIWRDRHDVRKYFQDYDSADIEQLISVFQESPQLIEQGQMEDFGVVLKRRDGGMQTSVRFYIEQSGGESYLFSKEESQANVSTTDGIDSSDNSETTYYPIEEVNAIAAVLVDARERISRST